MGSVELKNQIAKCTSCPLHRTLKGPVPFEGNQSSGVAVIQKAPTIEANRIGRQFSEQEKEAFDSIIESYFPDPLIFSLASCTTVGMNAKRQSPVQETVKACSKNFSDQMAYADPKIILLLDDVVLKRFRPEFYWTPMKGVPFFLNGSRLTMCVDHPVHFTGGGSSEDFEESVSYLHYLSTLSGEEKLKAFPSYCWCGRRGIPVYPDGIVKCDRCRNELEKEMQVL